MSVTPMARSTNVFISYATDTKPMAEALTRALQREGIHAWADFQDLKPGQIWKDEIEQALDKAESFVIMVSPQSRTTPRTDAEWRLALTKAWSDSNKVLIPVVVGGSESPPFLRDWVSLHVDPGAEPNQLSAEILKVLRSSRNRVGIGASDRQERQKRLDEMALATEELRKRESINSQTDADRN